MFNKIISMPETMYLGFGIMIPWDNNLEIQFNFWREAFASGRINKLKKICGSEQVVGIFCYKCDMEMQTFSYHIACENKLNASNPDFDELRLVALDFACLKTIVLMLTKDLISIMLYVMKFGGAGYLIQIIFLS